MGNTQTNDKKKDENALLDKTAEKTLKSLNKKSDEIVNRMISNDDGDQLLNLFRKAFNDILTEGEIMEKISQSLKKKLENFKEFTTQDERILFIKNEIESERELIDTLKQQKQLKKSIVQTEEEKKKEFEKFFKEEILGEKNYVSNKDDSKRLRTADGRKRKPKSKHVKSKSKSKTKKSKRKNKKNLKD